MRVLLISANTETISMPPAPLGLGLVAEAARRAGHDVRFLDLMFQPDPAAALREAIAASAPEAIGISVRNVDNQDIDEPHFLLEKVKPVVAQCRAATTAPIILGGAGYSIFPDEMLAYLSADYGVCGDGEIGFPALLEALQAGRDPSRVPGVRVAGRPAVEPLFESALDSLPLPERDAWASPELHRAGIWLPIQSRRGCPNECSYCSTSRIEGRVLRLRTPRLVIDHLERLAHAGFSRFHFVDNSFNIPESQGMELCRQIIARKLPVKWRCIIYPHRLSRELAEAMAQAGCVEAALGFESGSEPVLRAMNKHFSPDDVRRVCMTLAAVGIGRFGFLLLGGPGESRATVNESFAFAKSLPLDDLKTTVGIRIYPGTALAKQAVAEGVIQPDESLLAPHFYLNRDVAPWIREAVRAEIDGRD